MAGRLGLQLGGGGAAAAARRPAAGLHLCVATQEALAAGQQEPPAAGICGMGLSARAGAAAGAASGTFFLRAAAPCMAPCAAGSRLQLTHTAHFLLVTSLARLLAYSIHRPQPARQPARQVGSAQLACTNEFGKVAVHQLEGQWSAVGCVPTDGAPCWLHLLLRRAVTLGSSSCLLSS